MDVVRHCPRCDTDYRPEIETCAECGGELDTRPENPPPASPAPPDLPPGDYQSLFYCGEIRDLEPLAEALARNDIPFQIDATKDEGVTLVPHSRFDLKVRDEEREKAREILSSLPEAADLQLADDAAEKDFEPGRGYRRCPGCASTLPFGALKCPECGLALEGSLEPLVCSKCGWEVSTADIACPNCSAPLED